MDGLSARNAGFVLRFDNGLLFLEHAKATVGGLRAEAQGTLRRTGKSVSLSGRASFAGTPAGLPHRVEGTLDATALGDTPAQLVSALSGAGVLRHAGLTLPGLPPQAFGSVIDSKREGGVPQRADVETRLRAALTGTTPAPPAEVRLTLGGGVVRIAPLALADGKANVMAAASFDLKQMTFAGRMTYQPLQAPKDWIGAVPPQASFLWRGPLNALTLDVDASELTNGLASLAIRRETERIDALEQDQRERSFFNRRLRASEDERRAEEERLRREALARARAEQLRAEQLRAEQQRVEQQRLLRERERAVTPRLNEAVPPLAPPIQILPNVSR
jgi:hypothetical protein